MHAPINGSTINLPAKLYKRFMVNDGLNMTPKDIEPLLCNSKPTSVSDIGVIQFEKNYYVYVRSFRYIESTDEQEGEFAPIEGLKARTAYKTIKYNGKYKVDPSCIDEPREGDILKLDGELWVIDEGIQRVRLKSMRNFATVFLPIQRVL